MSIIPAQDERLDLFEGSTFDETWTFKDEDDALIDLTSWGAALTVRATYDGPPLLEITSGALTPGPTAKAILLGGTAGTARIYVGSTIMAALNASAFDAVKEHGETTFQGVWDIELINVALERFRYAMGPAVFSPEATY